VPTSTIFVLAASWQSADEVKLQTAITAQVIFLSTARLVVMGKNRQSRINNPAIIAAVHRCDGYHGPEISLSGDKSNWRPEVSNWTYPAFGSFWLPR
jgi:hypothetical protein